MSDSKKTSVNIFAVYRLKQSHDSKRKAKQAAKNTVTNNKLYPYHCKHCGKEHITHLTSKAFAQKKRDFALIRLLECDLYGGTDCV